MTRCLASILGYLLSACLALYAPGGMAGSIPSGATFSMVICSDGVARTIEVGLDGMPVPESDQCGACLDCCSAAFEALPSIDAASSPRLLASGSSGRSPAADPTRPETHLRPMPRGPPAVAGRPMLAPGLPARSAVSTEAAPGPSIRSHVGRMTGLGGRPSKDPTA